MFVELDNQKIELAITQLNKTFGAGSVMRLGSAAIAPWPVISTGALTLDVALGIGGLPRGRIVEVFGAESSSKTTLALSLTAEAQALGMVCAYIDMEASLDPSYMHAVGVDLDQLLLAQPSYGEEALEIAIGLINTGSIGLIVIDSVAALVPKDELEADMNHNSMGLQARMMSQAMRKMGSLVAQNKVLLVFINQLRSKVGVIYGTPFVTAGGNALKFYSSVRIDLSRKEDIKAKDTGELTGIRVKAKIVKNKMAAAYRIAEYDVLYGSGINRLGCVVDMALSFNILEQNGSWISYNEKPFAQGRARAIEMLASDLDLAEEITKKVYNIHAQGV